MAGWITHLMIADKIMEQCPKLDRRGFCVGNIAPDCNVENEDWTAFEPPREVTHWMSGDRKVMNDCDRFCTAYILDRKAEIRSQEEYSFLLGYYVHLLADAAFQKLIRDEKRVKDAWKRLKANDELRERAKGYPEDWDSMKKLIPKKERLHELDSMEAEYLRENPASGYLTEIVTLKEFPDYIDYLPHGGIVRKIGVMGQIPEVDENLAEPIAMSKEELRTFAEDMAEFVISRLEELKLL